MLSYRLFRKLQTNDFFYCFGNQWSTADLFFQSLLTQIAWTPRESQVMIFHHSNVCKSRTISATDGYMFQSITFIWFPSNQYRCFLRLFTTMLMIVHVAPISKLVTRNFWTRRHRWSCILLVSYMMFIQLWVGFQNFYNKSVRFEKNFCLKTPIVLHALVHWLIS